MHKPHVVAYSANPWDTQLTLKIECADCQSEWGWCPDERGNHSRLISEAEAHRRNFKQQGDPKNMTDYAFTLTAQQWRDDPYYVASSAPVHKVTVVASTKQEAFNEAERVLGAPSSHRYWRYWVKEMKDVRLIPPTLKQGDPE